MAPCRSLRDRPDDGATILVVDDEPRMRRLARRMLSTLGYRVIEADNADAAAQVLGKDGGVDLLFADVVMPGEFNGRDLGNWARRHYPRVKVLLTSGFPQEGGEGARQGESLPFLRKPYSPGQLEEAVRHLLNGQAS